MTKKTRILKNTSFQTNNNAKTMECEISIGIKFTKRYQSQKRKFFFARRKTQYGRKTDMT